MARALELAARADHRTSPNPMVGAVVLDAGGRLAGEGFHERAGMPHAEAVALAAAGESARGGILYVTLEPCSHHGRTPPCADAIVAAGIARVVAAMEDPDPRVRGAGLARLQAAGVAVEVGEGAGEARRLNRFFIHHRETGRPFVTAKLAISLDGRVATREGDSRWITSDAARAHAHRERHRHDAILVGSGTILADDPELTARFEGARQPLRVVLDRRGRLPAQARVLRRPPDTLVWRGEIDDLLDELGRRSILSVMAEGGPGVHGALFDAGLVDGVLAYIAPLVIGGLHARAAVEGLGPARLASAARLGPLRVLPVGPDLVVEADVHRDR